MKVEIKNENHKPKNIKPLIEYFESLSQLPVFEFEGLIVELDPTIDCKANNALIRWTDINEGFNDKLIINSLAEFKSYFKLVNA
jgi:hypothetical protein